MGVRKKISLSSKVEKQLDDIYDYCKEHWGARIAKKKHSELMHTIMLLKTHPYIGCIEPVLEDIQYSYRSIIEGYYRIIYFVDEEEGCIIITTLFDTRQNPNKITTITD